MALQAQEGRQEPPRQVLVSLVLKLQNLYNRTLGLGFEQKPVLYFITHDRSMISIFDKIILFFDQHLPLFSREIEFINHDALILWP